MRWLLSLAALFCVSVSARAAEIAGRIVFRGSVPAQAAAGYVGRAASGETVNCFAGGTLTGDRMTVWCDTYRPRRSLIAWDREKGCSYRHTALPAGAYLIYARVGERIAAWKVVKVASASAAVRCDLSVDPTARGDVIIEARRPPGALNVRLTPVAKGGKSLLPAADLGTHLGVDTDLANGSVRFDGLLPGTYRAELRRVQRGSRGDGSWAVFHDVTSFPVTVRRGKAMRYTAR